MRSPEFNRWFGNSKVVDKLGNPLVMYHGTDSQFDEFMYDKIGSNFGLDTVGFFFTSDKDSANRSRKSYPNKPKYRFDDADKVAANSGYVMPVYLKIENPLYARDIPDFMSTGGGISSTNLYDANREKIASALSSGKYDGFLLSAEGSMLAVVLNPNQIKSVDSIGFSDSNNIYESAFVNMLDQMKEFDTALIESIKSGYETLFEGDRDGGKRLSQYPRYSGLSRVVIYRAQSAESSVLPTDSYTTLSPKFAIEHAENNHVYNDEPQIVIRVVVNPVDVADANNPGEYIYKGKPVNGVIAYRTLGYEFDTENIPDITKTILESDDTIGGRRIKYVPFTKVDYRLKMWEWLQDNKKKLSEKELERFKAAYANLMDDIGGKINPDVFELFHEYNIQQPSQKIEYTDEAPAPEPSIDEQYASKYTDALNNLGDTKSDHRGLIPKFRGITMDKLKKHLKSSSSAPATLMKREIAKFSSAEELASHMYYHGTGTSMGRLKVGGVLPADSFRSGGYEDMQHSISVSKSKAKASAFTGDRHVGTVYNVLLKKNVWVLNMDGKVQDAMDLEEFLPKLWEANIDAVWIGGGEEELVVLNPRAIVLGKGESFSVMDNPKFSDDDAVEFAKQYDVELK